MIPSRVTVEHVYKEIDRLSEYLGIPLIGLRHQHDRGWEITIYIADKTGKHPIRRISGLDALTPREACAWINGAFLPADLEYVRKFYGERGLNYRALDMGEVYSSNEEE